MTYSILISSKHLERALEIIALLALFIALLRPRLGAARYRALESKFGGIARRRWTAVLFAAAFPLAVRLALLPVFPQPVPRVHDEFSYLLMADTFAHGRIANPTPPEWRHFETEYVLLRPKYASEYQPAQGLVMAGGEALTGQPWWGVWASVGLMCGALCWALGYLLPLRWALCGALGAALQFGILGFWMNSYFGGAVAATGGAIAAGALLRMRARLASSAILCGIGLIILLASRPLEGILFTGVAAVWIFVRYRRSLSKIILPAALIYCAGSTALAYYNFRVTDNPLEPPYEAGRVAYG
ncbi:MAG TPA: hypothetical protein VHC72_21055, partial [Bryobacteraceae bacterium]|nr:hypothetical protein [Bryobacteraceae bacterium]